jgi:serine/threonine protein kinase
MNDIYKKKYFKYKRKYILLKQQGGTYVDYIGEGEFGCLICPPIKLTDEINNKDNEELGYKIPGFSFDNMTNCDYVGKIIVIESQSKTKNIENYKKELKALIKINKDLDKQSIYTPQLIYANIHKGNNLINSIKEKGKLIDPKVLKCVNAKINPESEFEYGYIILTNVGITLSKTYGTPENSFDTDQLILFLTKFNKLFEFIKILYDRKYLHLDIKINNITVKQNGDLCLIDFGRTMQINSATDCNNIINYFKFNFYMYSFEFKIYINLLKFFQIKNIKKISLTELITKIKENFKILIVPYDISKIEVLYEILETVFKTDFEKQLKTDFDKQPKTFLDYIYHRQKEYFFNYLDKLLQTSKNVDSEIEINELLYNIFYPIIKKTDMYCMGIVLSIVVILYNNKYDKYNLKFKDRFENLIKSLLFNKFDNVDQIINEINEIIKN